MLETVALICALCIGLAGYFIGHIHTERRHRRDNAATAACAACEWTSGPVPLAEAFQAAHGHTGPHHPAMVVKA